MHIGLPRWSPDGKHIAFTATRPDGGFKNFLVSADGALPSNCFPVTKTRVTSTGPQMATRWSSGLPPPSQQAPFQTVNLLDLRTRKLSVVLGSEGLFSPHWSPDGLYIAALSFGRENLMRYDFKTQEWQN